MTALDRYGKVAVLMGGKSAEREISLMSGQAVLQGLLRAGVDAMGIDVDADLYDQLRALKIDRVFNMLHGRGGEDGTIQGFLETLGIPYTGSGVLASALAMDKMKTKLIWQSLGLPTPKSEFLTDGTNWTALAEDLGELVVKPSHEGSSIGMSMVSDANALEQAYLKARAFDTAVMAEQRIFGKEFTVPVINGEVYPAIQLHTSHEFYDFDAKYKANDTQYLCPAPLSATKAAELSALCMAAFDALGACGWGRVDVMQDKQERFWLLELNTVPGMTDHSLVPMSAAAKGISFEELVVNILQSSCDHE
ncbi:D-alanine--D-alanine ligase [Pseudohongiella spirulinae]|uniref:D-alanine--D-alanine ligase n=1 Tax=Pseudohongiella spirulinae TaxID=1249552 RepID=A0A0S2KF26_9GAMM|nr:D-alanine--D-alanine ligase [Pseudohongiella spirulinae]ALO46928.1 D-alanine--D-alanine ligase [Pseudohongiella spirulinae]